MTEKDSFRRYLESLYFRCYQLLSDHQLAQDAVQDVMLKFHEISATKDIENPNAYLYRMGTNHCLNLMKSNKRWLPLSQEHLESLNDHAYTDIEGKLKIDRLIKRFGQEAVQMLVYRHVDQMTYEEIGEVCGMSDRGVKKKLERLEEQFRKYLTRTA